MDAVVFAFGDASLLFALVQRMYRLHALRELRRFACACRRFCFTTEAAARALVLRLVPGAACPQGEQWSAHAELWSALGFLTRPGDCGDILPPLRYALYGSRRPPWAETEDRVAQADRLVEALVDHVGPAAQLLGRQGPLGMLPLQRRLLRRLSFDLGALRRSVDLARLASEKAQGTAWAPEVALDLAEVMHLRASAKAFDIDHALSLEELEDLLRAASAASPLSRSEAASLRSLATPRARQLLGRAMASTAQVWLLDTSFKPEVQYRLAERWGDGEALLHEALVVHSQAVDLAVRRVEHRLLRLRGRSGAGLLVPPASVDVDRVPEGVDLDVLQNPPAVQDREALFCGRCPPQPDLDTPLLLEALALGRAGNAELRAPLLELGECVAGLAECWFCIASVARLVPPENAAAESQDPQDVLDIGAENAANKALETFEDALHIYSGEHYGPGHLDRSVEYADALKDYGKVIAFFFDENDLHVVKQPLRKSLRLHEELLGAAHPRTMDARRLCIID